MNRSHQRLLLTLGLLCSLVGGAMARPLSLADAVNTALTSNPEVTAADQDITVARTKTAQIRAQEQPKVTMDAAYLDFANVPVMKTAPITLPMGGQQVTIPIPDMPLAASTVSTASVNFTLPLSTGGRVKYGLAQVNEGVAALHARADSTRRDVAYSVVQAYLGAVLALRVADVAEQSYATVQQHLTQAQALLQQGQIPRYEVIRAETELANADRRRLDAHNQANLALAYLQDVMGVPQEDTPTLTTTLQGTEAFALTLDDATAVALRSSSDMQALAARDRLYAAAQQSARAEMNPVIGLVATKELYINSQPFTTPGTVVGLAAQLPLYDGGLSKAKITEQQALRERNQSDVTRLTNGIHLEVRKYYLDLQSASKALLASDKAVELATESLRLATRRFEEGQGTGIEESDATLALALAQTNREQARYQYDLAYYGLQKAMGQLLTAFPPEEAIDGAR